GLHQGFGVVKSFFTHEGASLPKFHADLVAFTVAPGQFEAGFGLPAENDFLGFLFLQLTHGGAFADEKIEGDDEPEDEGGGDAGSGREGDFVAAGKFVKAVGGAGGPGVNRLVGEEAFEVCGEGTGGFVSASAVFFEGLHGDPVEVAFDKVDELWRFGAAAFGGGGEVVSEHGVKASGGGGRFGLADSAAHGVQAGVDKFLGIERSFPCQQFVKQNAERIDVAAGVDVEA